MDPIYALFLEALRTSLQNKQVAWGEEVKPQQLSGVLSVAQEHHVLPMILETVYDCPAAKAMHPAELALCKRSTVQSVMAQAVKTEEFLELYRNLRGNGITPLVVKGIICRNLYPQPDYRFSGDEDVLCGEERFKDCHKAMVAFGMEPCSADLESYEVPYRKIDGGLYIELHKTLFQRKSDVFGECNQLFEKAFERSVEIEIQGERIATLGYTDHMLYLILHAFKHFLHSGFGIRQVSDMVLFANTYGQYVDWKYVLRKCRSIRADKFAAAIFRIGEKYLTFSPEKACYPKVWREIKVDEKALLEDMLWGGIYGASDRSRVHSSNMTLNAVAADKKGKKGRGNLFKTVFPPADSLEGRFPFLKRRRYLLPVAWVCRIFGYARETMAVPSNKATDAIRTGSRRIELLREYEIID